MKLELMKKFYDTVDDEGRSPLLNAISSRWFESEDVRVIRASANFVARVENEEVTYYLRFNHESERSICHINNELSYIHRLISKSIQANKPIPSLTGALVESVPTKLGVFNAIMFSEVKGEHIKSSDLNFAGFSKWGASLAKIHNASHGLELENAPVWSDQLKLLTLLVPENTVLMNEANSVKELLNQVSRGNYGLTVFDFEMDNIKWRDGEPGFMDFDDYCIHWYAADIVYALRDLYDDKVTGFDREDERFKAFLQGYRSVRKISDEELDHIPVYIRLHNLYFYARLHRANTESSENDPDWVKNLSIRLGENNESYLREIIENPIS